MKITPVIMAGGAGTRLWPLSREEKPKQFHNLSGNGSLMNETIRRLLPLKPEHYVIVTSRRYQDLTTAEIRTAGINGIVLCEPRPRNTAAAILYAAIFLDKYDHDSVMVVLPADHFITNNERFAQVIDRGVKEAMTGSLVTIGIKPSYAETGYGYIKCIDGACGDILPVDCFVEKPGLETARAYCESGQYFWNSGIFIWKVTSILESFIEYMPGLVRAFDPLHNLTYEKIESNDPGIWKIKEDIFNSIESVSIDTGIMEKARNKMVIPADFGWADLGSWKAIDDILARDENGNRTPSPDKVIFVNSKNCSAFTEGSQVAVVGLSDTIVVQAGNAVLAIDKESSQDVRKVVDLLKKR